MIIRSKAPLRIGLAGGGSDVSPYSDIYGGAILNATINQYAYASLEPTNDNKIIFQAIDKGTSIEYDSATEISISEELPLHSGIYNRIVKQFVKKPLSFRLITHVDAPPGSGLGSSSTLVTTILGAFAEWLKLPLGEYDIAKLAYEIERIDLKQAGGKQDQYAATFGGFNFMEFYANDKVIVNPLRIKNNILNELSYSMVLYFTGASRSSSNIIAKQQQSVNENQISKVEAMHKIKEQAILMKEALLKEDLNEIGPILDFGWKNKKQMADGITNTIIDEIYQAAIKAGSTGGKVSGAGGGGFMFFYCPNNTRHTVIEALTCFGGEVRNFSFSKTGLTSWIINY
ncbi:MAG TPA: GHMP kinase [Prolixibacteraceae bacterium]|nr:GHMP kinase [Prolixibacteraceae bacterium]